MEVKAIVIGFTYKEKLYNYLCENLKTDLPKWDFSTASRHILREPATTPYFKVFKYFIKR